MSDSHPSSRARRGGSARPLTGPTPQAAPTPRAAGAAPAGHGAADPNATRVYPRVEQPSPVTVRSNGSARPVSSPRGETPTTVQPTVRPGVNRDYAADRAYAADAVSAQRPQTATRPQRIAAGAGAPPTGPQHPAPAPQGANPAPVRPARPRRRRSLGKRLGVLALVIVIVIVGWFVGLGFWANSKLTRDDVLSGAANTPGTTYLLAGSDSRGDGTLEGDTTTGQRADTLMLVHVAENGHSTLVSLPRDTLVDIPGQGTNKLNAAYAFGGAPLLVQTVENLTGLTVDHYVEVGFAGVENIVNAVGTVNVCLPQDVNDPEARLNLTAGCHDVDGATALAFVRVRHFDPTADLGRQTRQQEFMKSLTGSVMEPATFVNPLQQASLAKAVTGSITIDQDSNIVDLARLGLAFRSATGPDGTVGQIPWINPNYASSVGSAIQIDPAAVRSYFESVRDGTLPASSAAE